MMGVKVLKRAAAAVLLVVQLLSFLAGSGFGEPTAAEAAVSGMSRLDFIKGAVEQLGMAEKPEECSTSLTAMYKSLLGFSKKSSVYVYVNSGLGKSELEAAEAKYGLKADKAVYAAAALKLGLINDYSYSAASISKQITNLQAALILVEAEHLLYGESDTITEEYLSDEAESYLLYGEDGKLKDIVTYEDFTWEKVPGSINRPVHIYNENGIYIGFDYVPEQIGHSASHPDFEVRFYRVETLYRTKTRSYEQLKISDEDKDFVISERISDISRIPGLTKKRKFAEAYMLGFIRGESDGVYTDTRSCRPNARPSADECRRMLSMLTDTGSRYPLSTDWKMCRLDTSDMPKYTALYDYVLDSYPNSYYDTGMDRWNANFYDYRKILSFSERLKSTLHDILYEEEYIIYPSEMPYFLADDSGASLDIRFKNLDYTFAEQTREFYEHIFNIDYRTIADDEEWYEFMSRYYDTEDIDSYIEDCLENHTIIKCDKVAADYSSIYYADSCYFCRAYVHMNIVNDDLSAPEVAETDEAAWNRLFMSSFACSNMPSKAGYQYVEEECIYYTRFSLKSNLYTNPKRGVWFDTMCTAYGVPMEDNGKIQLIAGMARSYNHKSYAFMEEKNLLGTYLADETLPSLQTGKTSPSN